MIRVQSTECFDIISMVYNSIDHGKLLLILLTLLAVLWVCTVNYILEEKERDSVRCPLYSKNRCLTVDSSVLKNVCFFLFMDQAKNYSVVGFEQVRDREIF